MHDNVTKIVSSCDDNMTKNFISCDDKIILGVCPDAEVEVNPVTGGKQSKSPYAFELLPPTSLFAAAKVAKEGATKYGESFGDRNYTKIPSTDHINHAIAHLYAHLAGDRSDEHLAHAIVRLLFAYDCWDKV